MTLHVNAGAVETGQPAPVCSLRSLDDATTSQALRPTGQVTLVDFWASWCGPCAKSFPFLNELSHVHGNHGLTVVGINMDEQRKDASRFLARHPVEFKVVADADAQCAKAFGVKAMPSSYLVDRNGIVRHIHRGFRQGDSKAIRQIVEQLLDE
jgi:DsbE subfamily thiol:disulfide oxidoreductase